MDNKTIHRTHKHDKFSNKLGTMQFEFITSCPQQGNCTNNWNNQTKNCVSSGECLPVVWKWQDEEVQISHQNSRSA